MGSSWNKGLATHQPVQFEGIEQLFARIISAAIRGVLVALLIATPSLLLPAYATHSAEMVALLALLAAVLTFAEYSSTFPSFVEFRDAPPLNRLRFTALFAMLVPLSLIAKHPFDPSNLTAFFSALGHLVGNMLDFPYSPVRLIVLMLPENAPLQTINTARAAAGISYLLGLSTIAIFLFTVRVLDWPVGNGPFNFWVNLPLFDPTTGGDIVHRLQRDGRINVILGSLLPFLIPAVVKLAKDFYAPTLFNDPHTLIWTMSAWSFLPASMIMRGVAMLRIADMIEEKRKRTYASAEVVQTA